MRSKHVKSPDKRFREIVKRFAEAGYLESEKDDYARARIYIPPSEKRAKKHLQRALAGKLETLPTGDFMKAYCSLAYLYPGFNPDAIEDWDGPQEMLTVAKEAWRRAEAGELSDNELYP